jgi:hypothetical protein
MCLVFRPVISLDQHAIARLPRRGVGAQRGTCGMCLHQGIGVAVCVAGELDHR